jgi:hypothetical protein
MRHKGRQEVSLLSVNGRVRLRRVRWHSKDEGSETPIDALLDRAAKTFSFGVREMVCRLNLCSTSFRKTAENLGRLASIDVSGESVRQLVEQEGKQAAQQVRRGRVNPGWDASDCVTDDGKTRVYVGCDGVKVPLVTDQEKRKRRTTIKRKRQRSGKRRRALEPLQAGAADAFKEFRVVAAYDHQQSRRIVAVTSGDCQQTGRLMRNVALAIKLPEADESIASVDGAPWIRNQLELHQIADHINLDYYHLKDYAQRTRREVYGEESEEGRAWLKELMRRFLEEDVESAWDHLIEWRKNLRGGKRKAADRLLGYVAERRDMIRYREFRDRDWQIGSGPTEAQCKTTTLRLKGRGRRWDSPNAEAIMALAAIEASGQWNSWWATPEAIAA